MLSVKTPLGNPSRLNLLMLNNSNQHWMFERVASETAQKFVVGQQRNRLKKTERKEEIQIEIGFNIKLLFFFT